MGLRFPGEPYNTNILNVAHNESMKLLPLPEVRVTPFDGEWRIQQIKYFNNQLFIKKLKYLEV